MLKKTVFAAAAASVAALMTACSGGSNLASAPDTQIFTSDGTNLASISAASRLTVNSTASISGLAAGSTVVAMDFNPNGGALVALGSDGRVYTINTATAAATELPNRDGMTPFTNKEVDIDFNPRAQNVFRVVTSSGDNVRQRGDVPANSTAPMAAAGARVAADSAFTYATGDSNAGKTIAPAAVAYTDSETNANSTPARTEAYIIDTANAVLARLGANPANGTMGDPGNPNSGVLTTIGALGVNLDGYVGFDVQSGTSRNAAGASRGDDFGFVVGRVDGTLRLFTTTLSSGTLVDLGLIPPAAGDVTAFAVVQR